MNKDEDFIRIDLTSLDANSVDTITISNWDNMNVSIAGAPSDYININTNFADIDLSFVNDWQMQEEWKEIRKAAENNEALQRAIERVKMLYYLSKDDGNSETGHQT